jgi:hypothetical protein
MSKNAPKLTQKSKEKKLLPCVNWRGLSNEDFFILGGFLVLCSTLLHRPSDSTVSEDAGIEPTKFAIFSSTVRRHSAKSKPQSTRSLDLLQGPYSVGPKSMVLLVVHIIFWGGGGVRGVGGRPW